MNTEPPTRKTTFILRFAHRNNPDGSKLLNQVSEKLTATSKAAAVAYGKTLAAQRGWFLSYVYPENFRGPARHIA